MDRVLRLLEYQRLLLLDREREVADEDQRGADAVQEGYQ